MSDPMAAAMLAHALVWAQSEAMSVNSALAIALGLVSVLGTLLFGLVGWVALMFWAELKKLREGHHNLRHDVTLVMFAQGLEPTTHPHRKGKPE